MQNYIADPYWPEVDEVVNLQKSSGMNRVRSEDKRESSLNGYLEQIGMTRDQYEALVVKSKRPWYRVDDETSPIIIPRHQLSGCLVQACQSAPAGSRFAKSALRALIQIQDLVTLKTESDCEYKRYVRPCDGTGKPLSNQRSLRVNQVIEDFAATGAIALDESDVKPEKVLGLLRYAGKYVGLGASRKMGYGRFTVAAGCLTG